MAGDLTDFIERMTTFPEWHLVNKSLVAEGAEGLHLRRIVCERVFPFWFVWCDCCPIGLLDRPSWDQSQQTVDYQTWTGAIRFGAERTVWKHAVDLMLKHVEWHQTHKVVR